MIALCRCPHGVFSPRLFWDAQLAFADSGLRRGPLAHVTALLFPKAKSQASPAEPVTVLKAARMFDGERVRVPGVCVIQGERIVSLSQGDAPAGATVIDLGDVTLMPGLIDCHTHVTPFIKKTPYETLPLASTAVSGSASESALLAFKNVTTLLSNGFTTIRDVGSFGPGVDVALRDAIDAGLVMGPRMLVATKTLSITGGHADDNGLAPWLTPDPPYEPATAHGPYGFRQLVRESLKRHADCIKITATGGVLSHGDAWDAPQMNLDEVAAITDEAHKFGLRVAAHAHGARGIATAVAGGCDSIEHCTGVSALTADEMKQRGTYLVPTVWASESIRTGASGATYAPAIIEKVEQACRLRDDGFRRAIAAGVRFAYGTDCAVFPHADNNKDFALLAGLGLSPLDVLKTATANAADLLGKADRGRIAAGLLADLVAFPGDVTAKIDALSGAPAFLMLAGNQLA